MVTARLESLRTEHSNVQVHHPQWIKMQQVDVGHNVAYMKGSVTFLVTGVDVY